MDREWLGVVLSEKEVEGATWAVFRAGTFVAVAEAVFDLESELAVISGLAVKPDLHRQRIGTEVLTHLLVMHRERYIRRHVAYAAVDNHVAQHCLKRVGFVLSASRPNEHGYLAFQRERAFAVSR